MLATHLTEVCRRHADEILTRDATKHLIDELKTSSPTVVSELIPSVMSLAEVQSILHLLLREQISIRQLSVILETLGDHATRSKDPILLAEYVRHRLARQICTRYRNAEGELYVVAFDPALEDRIRAGFRALGARVVHSDVAAERGVDVPDDQRGDQQADDAESFADRAGEPADSRGGEAADGESSAAIDRDEFQRSDAGYEDRDAGDGGG